MIGKWKCTSELFGDRWKRLYVGRFFLVKGRRKRIVEVLDENTSDRSVGIFFGCLTVKDRENNVYDLVNDGRVELWKDPDDYEAGTRKVGTHNIFFD